MLFSIYFINKFQFMKRRLVKFISVAFVCTLVACTRATSGTNGIEEEVNGKNKVWVKCKNTHDNGTPIIQIDVCFRKKNFVGMWYNHNSGTTAKLSDGYGVGPYVGTMTECFGFSSHDYKYARYSNGFDKLEVNKTVIITHGGTGKTLTLKLKYPQELL